MKQLSVETQRELVEALEWAIASGQFAYSQRIQNQNAAWCDGCDRIKAALAKARAEGGE